MQCHLYFEHAIVRVFVRALVRATARAFVRDSSIPFRCEIMHDETVLKSFKFSLAFEMYVSIFLCFRGRGCHIYLSYLGPLGSS